jgi:hypothetical protein
MRSEELIRPAAPMWIHFESCPLCASVDTVLLRTDSCESHPIWQMGLPKKLDWMHCQQ